MAGSRSPARPSPERAPKFSAAPTIERCILLSCHFAYSGGKRVAIVLPLQSGALGVVLNTFGLLQGVCKPWTGSALEVDAGKVSSPLPMPYASQSVMMIDLLARVIGGCRGAPLPDSGTRPVQLARSPKTPHTLNSKHDGACKARETRDTGS